MRNVLFAATGATLGLLVAAFALARTAALPEAHAQAMAAAGSEVGPVMMGMGGSQQNQNDLCWILFRDKARDRQNQERDRYALCLYRALHNGQAFDLVDVREVSYDFKFVQINVPGHNPKLSPQTLYEEYKKKEEERRKREEEERKNAKNP